MYQAMSFFSNAGIGDIGVENAGVDVVFANELLEKRVLTHQKNHPNTFVLCEDINKVTNEDLLQYKKQLVERDLFLLTATPPCQGVSTAGKRDKFDIRNQLVKPMVRAIQTLRPMWVWMENVPGYMKATIPDTTEIVEDDDTHDRINIIDYIKKHLEPHGYTFTYDVLDAKDFGVPQMRKRLIMIMTRTNSEPTLPSSSHGIEGSPFNTVRNAIGHLESLKSGEASKKDRYHFAPKHNPNHIKWMSATPEGQTAFDNEKFEDRPHVIDKNTGEIRLIKAFRTTYKRMWWDKPAPTITMSSGSISSQNNVHPSDPRVLSVRESMLIQTMPEHFEFAEGTSEKDMREMIGEAVPSLFAQKITEHIISLHESNKKK